MTDELSQSETRVRRIRDIANADIIHETGTSKMVSYGIGGVGLFVLAFFGWSAWAELDEITISLGEVVPVGSVRTVQHLEGGIVAEVLVEEGQVVEPGAPLVRFDAASASAEFQQVQARSVALQLQAERLRAFSDDRDPDFRFAQAEFPELLQDQMTIYSSEVAARQSQREVLQQQMAERRSELATNLEEQASSNRQVTLLQEEFNVREKMFEEGLTSRVMFLAIQRDLETAKGTAQRLAGNADTIRESVRELEQRENELDTRLRQEALRQLGIVTAELSEVQELLAGLSDRDARLTAQAPVRGIVQQVPVKSGTVVSPGGLVAEVVPMDDGVVIEGRVSTRDIGFVRPGQPVDVKVHTYDFSRYGSVPGRVLTTSATTFIGDDNTPYYRVRAELEQTFVGDTQGRNPVFPGMTVQMDIKTGKKTVLQYLLKPFFTAVNEGLRER